MDLRRAGLAISIVAALAFAGLLVFQPMPGTTHELVTGQASRAAFAPTLIHYDAANDTTLFAVGSCDHQPCGDAFAIRGPPDRLRDDRLLEPEPGATLAAVRADVSLSERAGEPPAYDDPDQAAGLHTWMPPMRLAPLWPPFLAYLASTALVLAGASLAVGARWSALGPLLGALAGLSTRGGGFFIVLIGGSVALILLALAIGMARRSPALSASLVASAIAFGASTWITAQFLPLLGSEI